MFNSYLHKLRSLIRRSQHTKDTNPIRDWEILLGGSAIISIILVGIGGFVFWQVEQGKFSQRLQTSVSVESIDRTKLSDVLQLFTVRQNTYDAARSNPPTFVDPHR